MNPSSFPLSYTQKHCKPLQDGRQNDWQSREQPWRGSGCASMCPSVFVEWKKPSIVDFVSLCPEEKSMCRILLYNTHLLHWIIIAQNDNVHFDHSVHLSLSFHLNKSNIGRMSQL